jgi:hypothetical protein
MMLMVLNRLIIEGDNYRRTLEFKKGLNIIQGDKYSGKSLVLNLIDYAFGKKENIPSKVQTELYEHCNYILLEISFNSLTMTFRRYLWKDKSTIEIFLCSTEEIKNYAPKTLNLEEFSKYLLNLLDIPEFKLLKHLRHSKEYTVETLSFRDLFRYIYVNQHELGTPNFMGINLPAKKNKNRLMFEILFEFLEFDSQNLVNKIKELENKKVGIEEQIRGLSSYLNEQQFMSKKDIQDIYDELLDQITEVVQHKTKLLSIISKSEQKNEDIYSKINNHINNLHEEILKLNLNKRNLEITIAQKENLISEYNEELNELLATKEANEILPKIEHNYKCPLCKQQVVIEEKIINNTIFSTDNLIKQLKDKIDTAQKSIAFSESLVVEKYNKKIARLLEEKMMYENAKTEYGQSIRTPYIPEIEAINKLLYDLSEKKIAVNEGIKIFNKIEEKMQTINATVEKIAKIKEKLKENIISEEDKILKLRSLEKRYKGFLLAFKQKVNDHVYIDSNTYLPVYNSAGLQEHESGGMLLCMQLAYLFAVLFTKISNDHFSHPGFFMFDTISKYLGTIKKDTIDDNNVEKMLDPEVYEKIYTVLSRVGNKFQILVVENTPPNSFDNKVRYTFHSGEHGLVDLSKNEKLVV